jgi:hypothetical protein
LYTSLNIGDVIPLVPVLLGEYSNIASDLTPKDCLTVPIEVSILVSTKSLALCTKLNIEHYNLGEGHFHNAATEVSSKLYPLTDEIKAKMNENN